MRLPSRTSLAWASAAATGGASTVHDVIRGSTAQLPVGGAGESCLADATPATTLALGPATLPGVAAFYYLVRATNLCGTGSYGFATSSAQRVSAVCP